MICAKLHKIAEKSAFAACKTRAAPRMGTAAVSFVPWCLVGVGELGSGVLNFVNDGLEGGRVVYGQVGQNFAVDLDAGFVDEAHEL